MKKNLCFLLAAVLFQANAFSIEIKKATCDMQENPLGINSKQPCFGWELISSKPGDKQTAYQLIIASSPEKINKNEGDIWNTGKIWSEQSQGIVYKGHPLQSATRYYWKVMVWDAKGKPSKWSAINQWDMALLNPSDWKGRWIGAIKKADSHLPAGRIYPKWGLAKALVHKWDSVEPLAKRSIQLRKDLSVNKKTTKALIYICGLGNYELSLNGTKVGDAELAPLWSDYDKTVYYNMYDVSQLLQNGSNTIGVILGNGMYNVTGNRYIKHWISFGPPTLRFQLHIQYSDGTSETIISDETWKYSPSPITFNCMYGGEDYDATLEQPGWNKPGFDESSWTSVVIQEGPKGNLLAQNAPPVKIMDTYHIKKFFQPVRGIYVFDMGQNLSGFPAIRIKGRKGQTVKILVGEQLNQDSLVSQKQSGGPYYLKYTLKGEDTEEWHPRFTYYGFQYIQIEGATYGATHDADKPLLLDVTSCFVYSAAENIGKFESSNELFNKTHWLINNAIKSNMQSVFTDCPHREKLGWLEETHLVGPGIIFNYNIATLLSKVQTDMADAQTPEGLVPDIAPEYVIFSEGFRDSPEWGSTALINPYMYYEFYGDSTLIVRNYDVMKKYLAYLTTKADTFILSYGLGDWYDYGNKPTGPSQNTPIPLTATAYFYYDALLLQKSAKMMGLTDDETKFAQLAQHIKNAFNKKFFNPDTKQYATGSQVSNAMALYFGLVEPQYKEAVLNNLVKDIRDRGNRLTSGDIGNRYLFQVLAQNNRNDIMFDMNNHYEVPGYGFQIKMGVTTLTENWDPRKGASWNHLMQGHIEEWFFRSLAGINPDPEQPGFKHIIIHPSMIGDITWVNSSYHSIYGIIESSWKKEAKTITLSVKIPVNTTATVYLPVNKLDDIKINNKHINNIKGITIKNTAAGNIALNIPSGEYMFTAPVTK